MKKHLAMLCGIYYPNPSPTGLCAKRYANLLKNEYDIEIIFMQSSAEEVELTDENGFRLHGICGARLRREYTSSGAVKKALHLAGIAEIKMKALGNMSWYRSKALKKLKEIHEKQPLDAVFTVCSPFAAHAAGADFKKLYQGVWHTAYTVDPYSSKNRVRPFFMTYGKLAELEKDILSKADFLLLSEELYKTRPDIYSGAKNCLPLPYMLPAFYEAAAEKRYFDEAGVHCVYAGRFYEDIRNPEYMLKTFAALENKDIKLHLFSIGCEGIVNRYAGKNPNIIMHSLVSQNEIKEIYAQADALVGVGNSISEFMPSKIYEYIAACKPILFFNYGNNHNEVLNGYPSSRQFCSAESTENSAKELTAFVKNLDSRDISRGEIENAYKENTPANITEILRTALNL